MPKTSKSSVTIRCTVVDGGTATIDMDDTFWRDLEEIAEENDLTVADLIGLVEARLGTECLSSALRTYIYGRRVLH